jgi:predicted transposase YbfD/YdcC
LALLDIENCIITLDAMGCQRKIALNLFKFDTTKKISMARKKKNAALNDEYRSVLLESAIKMR